MRELEEEKPENYRVVAGRDGKNVTGWFIVDGWGDPIFPDTRFENEADAEEALKELRGLQS